MQEEEEAHFAEELEVEGTTVDDANADCEEDEEDDQEDNQEEEEGDNQKEDDEMEEG